jgi:riboflavin kinase/FMN adenylyltransferase
MQVYRNIDDVKKDKKTVLTIGTFDGVHLAHRRIIDKVIALSKQNNSRSFIVTFDPHPQEVLKNKTPDIKILTTTDEKLRLFEKMGVEHVLIINFTEEFSKTQAREFYEKYIYAKIGIEDLVVGYDHLFGRNREGDFGTLTKLGEEFNFKVHKVEEMDIGGEPVSSSRIRKYFASGEVDKANELLGHEYGFDGIVVEGDKVGRSIGYPTVNLKAVKENKLMPGDGVYCVRVNFAAGEYYGMMYIGFRPTLSEGVVRALEVNLFDFDRNIYGEKLTVTFLKKLRDDIKFGSKEELIEQINKDKENSLKFLNIKIRNSE